MIELKDASLVLEGRELFKNLSLMAQDGQLTCITGPAGSGKTAIVQVLLGFLPLDEGLVSIDGELLTPLSAPAFRQLMAYVPQKVSVTISQPEVNIEGLETVWSPYNRRNYLLTQIDEHLDLVPMSQKPIVIADDPDTALFGVLKSLAVAGHTVVIASRQDDFINKSDKVVILGNHDTVNS